MAFSFPVRSIAIIIATQSTHRVDNCPGIRILAGTSFLLSALFCFSAVDIVGYGSFAMVVIFVLVVVGANSLPSATAFQRRLCGFSGARCLQPKTRSIPWASGSRTTTPASGGTSATYGLMTKAALWYLRAEASVTRLPRSLMWFGVNSHLYHGRRND